MVTAPAANVWDLPAIAADASAVLRLAGTDPDAERIEASAAAATELLDAELDALDPIDTATVAALVDAATQVTIELYRRKDVPFGAGGAWSPNEVPYLVDGDPLNGVRAMALPWKVRFGLA